MQIPVQQHSHATPIRIAHGYAIVVRIGSLVSAVETGQSVQKLCLESLGDHRLLLNHSHRFHRFHLVKPSPENQPLSQGLRASIESVIPIPWLHRSSKNAVAQQLFRLG